MVEAPAQIKLAAILAADVAGYTRLMANNDRAIVAALDAARAIFRAHVEHERGRIVDTAGDSVLAEFDTVSGAVRAALSIQGELEVQNPATTESQRLRFRIGIEMGEVIHKEDGSIYGAGVNVAARLQTIAINNRSFSIQQCCSKFRHHRRVVRIRILTRSKNIEVTQGDRFKAVNLFENADVMFPRKF